MRIFYYVLDSAVVNAWLIYRCHCWQSNASSTAGSPMFFYWSSKPSLHPLGYFNTPRRRPGRPLSLETEGTPPRKIPTQPTAPPTDGHHDGYHHFPEFRKDQKRCRICQRNTKILCSKYLWIALCLVPKRNCFLSYYRRWTLFYFCSCY